MCSAGQAESALCGVSQEGTNAMVGGMGIGHGCSAVQTVASATYGQ